VRQNPFLIAPAGRLLRLYVDRRLLCREKLRNLPAGRAARSAAFEAGAGQREDASAAGLPSDRQLARADFPFGRCAHEVIRVVAEHVLRVIAGVVGQIVARLHLCDADRGVAAYGNDVISIMCCIA
jgi:hypothetical protein